MIIGLESIAIAALLLSIAGGIVFARISYQKKQRKMIRARLDLAFKESPREITSVNIRKERGVEGGESKLPAISGVDRKLRMMAETTGIENAYEKFKQSTIIAFFAPLIIALGLDLNFLYALVSSILLSIVPYLLLVLKVKQIKDKFIQQLPEATDLIVSVLRTGHSIPRAIQTVSEEIPAPLGDEFKEIHHRLNLGQQLSEALAISAVKYDSHELDLIRRAVAIQSEVGGSLAELLDKTNSTLRQRIKLVRHVRVLTSQSRLTGLIVGALPLILATVLNYLNPGYLDPLFNKEIGKLLLLFALGLQVVGVIIMRKLSTVKV